MARKATYNLVILDGRNDFLADRQEIRPECRGLRLHLTKPRHARSWSRPYIPDYDPAVAPSTAGREAAQALMKLLTCKFDDMVSNSRKVSEIFEKKMLKESGREAGNWVNVDQAIWVLKEVVGMVNVERNWAFFIPIIKALPASQVDVMLLQVGCR